MSLTRLALEQRLIRMNRDALDQIGAGTDATGSHGLCGDAIEGALLHMGYAVGTLGAVADGDLSLVPMSRMAWFYAVCDVRLKEAILGSLVTYASEQDGPNRYEFSDMAKTLRATITTAWQDIDRLYAAGKAAPVSGVMVPKPVVPDAIARGWNY